MKKASIAVAAAAAGMVLASPATAQESEVIKVGLLDVGGGDMTFRDARTTIEHRDFVTEGQRPASRMTRSGRENGVMTTSAFVRQARLLDENAPIQVYSANIFQEHSDRQQAGSPRRITVNWEGAREAVEWFKQNDVKVVIASFNGAESQEMHAFMEETRRNGMTVFAGSGNTPGGAAFPAMHPYAMSVGSDNPGHAYRTDPSQAGWVDVTMNGGVPMRRDGQEIDSGATYATAKAAAFGSYYARSNPDVDPDIMRETLYSISTTVEYTEGDRIITAMRLDENGSAAELKNLVSRRASAAQNQNLAMNSAMMTGAMQR